MVVWSSGGVGPGICRAVVFVLGEGGYKILTFYECCYSSLRMCLYFIYIFFGRELYRDLWMVVTGLHDLTEQEYRQVL